MRRKLISRTCTTELSVYGRTIQILLIARRSRHFAGARFHKRGVNTQVRTLSLIGTHPFRTALTPRPLWVGLCRE